MSKDRARPFSPKHRRYWIPVTGGMLLIGAINVGIGVCTYEAPQTPGRIIPVLPAATPARAAGTIGLAEVPAPVMRAFAVKYPRHIPSVKKVDATTYELSFTDAPGTPPTRYVTYRDDGSWVGEH